MAASFKPFLDWFGYSRRERRSSFILVVIIIVMILLQYVFPGERKEIEIVAPEINSSAVTTQKDKSPGNDSLQYFSFDPNKASFKELSSLGLSDRQARTLINYRHKGGRFRRAADIYRIYGLDSASAGRLIPYIIIEVPAQQNIFPWKNDSSGSHPAEAESIPLTDINRCDSAGFERLPGIGPVLASRIVKYRELLGGFYSVSQLKEVYGLKDSAYNVIEGICIADTAALRMIDINEAGIRDLDRHPYLERYDAQAITKYRELHGRIEELSGLVTNRILTAEKAEKIKPYLRF